jgi:hypothetical protein
MPLIAFVITCRDRLKNLKQTLALNLGALRTGESITVLDYNCSQGTFDWVKDTFPGELSYKQLHLYRESTLPRYVAAHAKNVAHILGVRAGGEVLVNLDADNILVPEYMETLRSNNWVKLRCLAAKKWSAAATGRIAVRTDTFLELGGYNELLTVGYGYEDTDFGERVRNDNPGMFLHLSMPPNSFVENCGLRGAGQPLSCAESLKRHGDLSRADIAAGHFKANVGRHWGEANLVDWHGNLLAVGTGG